MTDLLLGTDLGTTSVKAGVFARDGTQLARFAENYPTTRPAPGMCEQDPADWIRLIDAAMNQFRAAGLVTSVRCGALTSQVNTHVFVDRTGRPLRPAILWQDTRAMPEARELNARITDAEKIALLGAPIPIDASHLLARMLWVQRNEPEIWEKTAYVLLPKDYALLHLTGELATDALSNIGLVGLDGNYVSAILGLVPGAMERIAPLQSMTSLVGASRDGPPFAVATMDGWVGLAGAGACRENAFAYLSGTSEILGLSSHTVTHEPGVVVFAEAQGQRLHAGPTQSGGASQQWFCDVAGIAIPVMAKLVEDNPLSRAPLFLPQLAGERAPVWNADLRGAFLGLEAGMQTAEFARAVYEGVALSARHVLGALEASGDLRATHLTCAGGGFRSDVWGQIRSDVLGRPLQRLALAEAGVVGAACIAAVASGLSETLAQAHVPFSESDREWEPDPNRRAFYDDLFEIYLEALKTTEGLGKRLAALRP
ncbi:MAG: FGGY-family carbohydrate kinase [Roseibium sp.]|uniref:xylulokinase n=1 Tax=Roseibium sp. TaxID=1936156 RepID=UPI003D9C3253